MKRIFSFLPVLFVVATSFCGCEDEYEDTKDVGEKFLEYNATQEGVIVSSKGLQYKPYYEDNVTWPTPPALPSYIRVNYTAFFINGDTLKTAQNATFLYSTMIEGWRLTVQRMHIGSKWRIWLPYQLAYGSDGNDDTDMKVDPYTALYYDMELLDAY